MKALLSNYRQSPRKVRLVTDAIRGKKATEALVQLSFLPKRAADPVAKVLSSAIANAKAQGADPETMVVHRAEVNAGYTLKRSMPRARGRAFQILKRTSNVYIELGQAPQKSAKQKGKSKGTKAPKAAK